MFKISTLFILCVFASSLWSKTLDITLASEKAILINAETGAILYEKRAHEKAYPASITKIATALYALSTLNDLEKVFTVSQAAIATITPQAKRQSNYRSPPYLLESDGCHMSLKRGEELSFYELLCGMLIASANDAANVIAENIGGTVPEFMKQLNDFLAKMGCKNTHFCNPHGLYHPDHQTSAFDMALISAKAMQIPTFREIVCQSTHVCPKTNFEYERNLVHTNSLLRRGPHYYSKAIGIKTGYTSQAGRNLVAAAENPERFLIAVVLASPTVKERYGDAINLFEAAFTEKKMRHWLFSEGGETFKKTVPHGKKELIAKLQKGIYYDFYPSEKRKVKARILWDIPPLPIEIDQKVGCIKLFDDKGIQLKEAPIYAVESLQPTLWYRLKTAAIVKKKILFAALSTFFIFILITSLRRKRAYHRRT